MELVSNLQLSKVCVKACLKSVLCGETGTSLSSLLVRAYAHAVAGHKQALTCIATLGSQTCLPYCAGSATFGFSSMACITALSADSVWLLLFLSDHGSQPLCGYTGNI